MPPPQSLHPHIATIQEIEQGEDQRARLDRLRESFWRVSNL